MKNKNIFSTALVFILVPNAQAADTVGANISLHVPERLVAKPMLTMHQTVPSSMGRSISTPFCVSGNDGLQFSVIAGDPALSASLKLEGTEKSNDNKISPHTSVRECHERDFGVLKITQLPQGKRSITAVVVIE